MQSVTFLLIAFLIAATSPAAQAETAKKLEVVASFSILADFVEEIGGNRVSVTSLVGPDSDAHVYEPTPKDVQKVALANVIVVNGLGLEGWLNRLLEASGAKAPVIEASAGVEAIEGEHHEEEHHEGEHQEEDHQAGESDHEHGVQDPHAFQSIRNAMIYVKNIAQGLCKAAPDDCEAFKANAATYSAQLEGLDQEVRTAIGRIPPGKRRIITSHDAFGYFAHDYGISFLAPEGISTDAEASAADVAKLIQQIREQKASALFVENISDKRLIEQIARETGFKVSGVLFSDALSAETGPAPSYIGMMRHNVRTILGAIDHSS
jgi:zinc/manganese transport system substrate-binding protein